MVPWMRKDRVAVPRLGRLEFEWPVLGAEVFVARFAIPSLVASFAAKCNDHARIQLLRRAIVARRCRGFAYKARRAGRPSTELPESRRCRKYAAADRRGQRGCGPAVRAFPRSLRRAAMAPGGRRQGDARVQWPTLHSGTRSEGRLRHCPGEGKRTGLATLSFSCRIKGEATTAPPCPRLPKSTAWSIAYAKKVQRVSASERFFAIYSVLARFAAKCSARCGSQRRRSLGVIRQAP